MRERRRRLWFRTSGDRGGGSGRVGAGYGGYLKGGRGGGGDLERGGHCSAAPICAAPSVIPSEAVIPKTHTFRSVGPHLDDTAFDDAAFHTTMSTGRVSSGVAPTVASAPKTGGTMSVETVRPTNRPRTDLPPPSTADVHAHHPPRPRPTPAAPTPTPTIHHAHAHAHHDRALTNTLSVRACGRVRGGRPPPGQALARGGSGL